jgi:hypothetical protein
MKHVKNILVAASLMGIVGLGLAGCASDSELASSDVDVVAVATVEEATNAVRQALADQNVTLDDQLNETIGNIGLGAGVSLISGDSANGSDVSVSISRGGELGKQANISIITDSPADPQLEADIVESIKEKVATVDPAG